MPPFGHMTLPHKGAMIELRKSGLRAISIAKERATSAEGLKQIARKVWKGVSSDYLKKLYESMPRCMQAVIDAEGGHTKY